MTPHSLAGPANAILIGRSAKWFAGGFNKPGHGEIGG
jgi:hypothetical protein